MAAAAYKQTAKGRLAHKALAFKQPAQPVCFLILLASFVREPGRVAFVLAPPVVWLAPESCPLPAFMARASHTFLSHHSHPT